MVATHPECMPQNRCKVFSNKKAYLILKDSFQSYDEVLWHPEQRLSCRCDKTDALHACGHEVLDESINPQSSAGAYGTYPPAHPGLPLSSRSAPLPAPCSAL